MPRAIVLILAVVISLPFIMKSRVSGIKSAPAAFSVVSSSSHLVRISGDVRYPGIYPVSANILTHSAIEMAVPIRAVKRLIPESSGVHHVERGDDLHLTLRKDGTGTIVVGSMPASDRMILGIPLDINAMNEADFDRLPGIGPVMAQRIVAHRQKNGGNMRVEDLQAIVGIGEKKYKALCRYF